MTTIVGLVIGGDSIAAHPGSYTYQAWNITRVNANGGPEIWFSAVYRVSATLLIRNVAIPATRLNTNGSPDLVPLAPVYIDPSIPTASALTAGNGGTSILPTRKYIFYNAIGSNDSALGGYSTVGEYAAAVAACNADRKTAGFHKTLMATLLPRNDGPLTEPNRTAYNSLITGGTWAADHGIDGIVDLASEPTMGNPASCSNVTYYEDGVHPTAAGHALLAPIFLSAINAVIATL